MTGLRSISAIFGYVLGQALQISTALMISLFKTSSGDGHGCPPRRNRSST